jgi:Flp pilus assembly protein CpaB
MSRFVRRAPRARVLQVAAMLAALMTVRLVAGDLGALHRGARTYGAMRAVVLARADLDVGMRVRAHDVRVVELPGASLPPHALADAGDAVGRVVTVPVLAGAAITSRALAPSRRDGVSAVVPPDRRAVRVVGTDGLRPDPGSVVDVLATLESRDVGGDVEPTAVVAHAARVLSVDAAPSHDEGADGGANRRVGVVVLVTIDEASHIADATARGALMLALDPPDAVCDASPVSCRP